MRIESEIDGNGAISAGPIAVSRLQEGPGEGGPEWTIQTAIGTRTSAAARVDRVVSTRAEARAVEASNRAAAVVSPIAADRRILLRAAVAKASRAAAIGRAAAARVVHMVAAARTRSRFRGQEPPRLLPSFPYQPVQSLTASLVPINTRSPLTISYAAIVIAVASDRAGFDDMRDALDRRDNMQTVDVTHIANSP